MFKTETVLANGLKFSVLAAGEGTPVFFLHGFPDYNETFRHQMEYFAQRGYKVYAPMLRGYEVSSQPAEQEYYVSSLAQDVIAQFDALGIKKAHLVGHDWGAIITYAVAAVHSDRLLSATTIAVPYLKRILPGLLQVPVQVKNSWYILFFQLPLLSNATVEANDFAFLEKLYENWSPGWQADTKYLTKLKEIFRQPGVIQAALSYYRSLPDILSDKGRESIRTLSSAIGAPLLAITGEKDGCLDTRLYDVIMRQEDFPGGLKIERIAGAGHFVQQENPSVVNELLAAWFERYRQK